MIYSEELSFCFVAVPKTGTTSIEHFLTNYCLRKDVGFIRTTKANTSLRDVSGKHASIAAIKASYSTTNVITAGFVRNPWDKVVSWFNYLKHNRQSIHTIDPSVRFEEFLYSAPPFVFTQSCQYLTNINGDVDVDFVGRFEEFELHFSLLCDLFNVEWAPLKKMNSTHNDAHYSEFYTPDTVRFVEELSLDDIKLFGYSFEER
jgi:hypothetical protein